VVKQLINGVYNDHNNHASHTLSPGVTLCKTISIVHNTSLTLQRTLITFDCNGSFKCST
jgi:hypothetical protein